MVFQIYNKKLIRTFLFYLLLNSIGYNLLAQKKITLCGYIKDGKTGESIIGANILIPDLKTGTVSNSYGFYSITGIQGKYLVNINFMGYKTLNVIINLDSSKIYNAELFEDIMEIKEVTVTSKPINNMVQSNQTGLLMLDLKQIKQIPVLFGELDILKTIQLTPGVKSTGEGSCGFYVRGGSADQNLILLDEAPVYNASHLLGFFSVFNSNAIKDVELYKGGIPASYGGRASSVLDIKMNEGNMKNYSVSGGIGLISSKLAIEGPIVKNKSSFIISGRRTYADLLAQNFGTQSMKKIGLYFYDINAKTNFIINPNNRIYLSGYFGRDVFNYNDRFGFEWGNTTATLRWNHLFSDKMFMNTSLIFSDYNYKIGIELGSNRLDVTSGIRDYNIKQDFEYFHSSNHCIKFGYNVMHHTFFPGKTSYNNDSVISNLILEKRYSIETGIYLQSEVSWCNQIKSNIGFRLSNFTSLGPGNYYKFDSNGNITDTIHYSSNAIVKSFFGLEPRANLVFMLSENTSLKISYTRMYQYLHLLSKATSTSPSDLWIPSSNIVKPQYADQYSLGYFKNLFQKKITLSVEIYYKNLFNQIDYKNGADITINKLVESQLVFGKGKAYGLEVMVAKKEGIITGWIAYTLSKTERTFSDINNENPFPARQDITHDISIVSICQPSPKWIFSATWVFYTGNAVTFPAGKYTVDNETVIYYTKRNGARMPDYHRLDLGITFISKKTSKKESSWNFSLYNAYGRKNPYSISFRESKTNPNATEAVKLSLFSFVPSITYSFKF
jgi:hypothetical protein